MSSGYRYVGLQILLVCLLSVLSVAKAMETRKLELAPDIKVWHLAGYLSVGTEAVVDLPISQVLEDKSLFHPHPGIPAWGFSTHVQWVRFTLKSGFTQPTHWLLEVAPVFTDYLTLYWIDDQGQVQKLQAGDLIPAAQRPLNLPQQVFPLRLEAGEHRVYWLSIEGTNPLFADIYVWEPNTFLEHAQKQNFYMSAYLGILVLMTLLGILYAGILRDWMHGSYTLYVLTQLGFQIAHTGYLGWLVNLPWTRLPDLLASASVTLSLGIFAVLFAYLTRLREDFPRLSHYYLLMAWLVTITGLIFVLFDRYVLISSWIHLYILLLTTFAVVFSIYRLFTGAYRLGSIYLLVFGVMAIGVTLRILRDQGVLPNNLWTENTIYLGTLVHLLAMQFVIITGINQSRKSYAKKLEDSVNQRTQELQERNQQLLQINQQNLALQADLKQSLEKESQTRQAQQDFMRMVSNEFRSPLSVIDGSLTLLNMQPNADLATRNSWLERIKGAQQRLVSLVESSHWDQRLSDETWEPTQATIALLPWMLQMTENLKRMYNPKQVILRVDTEITLEMDPDILKMLLQGLVDAVVLYSPQDKPVFLDAYLKTGYLVLCVGATGNVVLPALKEQLARRYSETTRTSSSGLYLARAAAKKVKGEVEYTLLEQGACFLVTLPIKTKASDDT